ncbi:hypothetical protein [Azotobacter vinelandii]|uniref:hypothetical protein n=1 Tax=Azotobacter vinelandii TaxID=354 RepID=UPI00266621BB|nr:hypothetical protein [Azotobacter vinelandii]WKN20783.1 hypothetical protein AVAEIV_003808 [Azotobacter vinelandii]
MSLSYRRSVPLSELADADGWYLFWQSFPASRFNCPVPFIRSSAHMAVTLLFVPEVTSPFPSPAHWELSMSSWVLPSGPVDLLIFDDWEPPQDTFGIEVFRADGSLAFNSGWPILMLHDVATLAPLAVTFSQNYQHPISDTGALAVGLDSSKSYYHGGAEADGWMLCPGSRVEANQISVSLVPWGTESASYPSGGPGGSVAFSGYLAPGNTTMMIADTSQLPAAPYRADS